MRIKIADKEGNIFLFAGIETKVDIVMIDDNNFDVHCADITKKMKGNAKKLIEKYNEGLKKNQTCFNFDLRLQ